MENIQTAVLSRDGWDYIVCNVAMGCLIRVERSYLPRLRRVTFGCNTEDGVNVMNPTSPSSIAELEITTLATIPWGGFQVFGLKGEQVPFVYVGGAVWSKTFGQDAGSSTPGT